MLTDKPKKKGVLTSSVLYTATGPMGVGREQFRNIGIAVLFMGLVWAAAHFLQGESANGFIIAGASADSVKTSTATPIRWNLRGTKG